MDHSDHNKAHARILSFWNPDLCDPKHIEQFAICSFFEIETRVGPGYIFSVFENVDWKHWMFPAFGLGENCMVRNY